jgi:hypothetical protein
MHAYLRRYELRNGEALVNELRALRGAECTNASFTPPQEMDATIKGAAAPFCTVLK